jgi:hypothetical protein
MPRAERSARRRLAAQVVLAALVVLVAIPAYLALERSWRAALVRLVCAAVVLVGGLRVRRLMRRAIGAGPASPLDGAPPAPPAPILDARFGRLRDDLASSARSRRYFDAILWPRLQALGDGALPPPAPSWTRWRRGPSLRALEGLIARIEARG